MELSVGDPADKKRVIVSRVGMTVLVAARSPYEYAGGHATPAQARQIAAELNRLADEVEGGETTESLHRRVAKLEAAICDLKARGDLAREAKATQSTGSPYDLSRGNSMTRKGTQ